MIRVTNVQTVFEMVAKGAVLVIKRGGGGNKNGRELLFANLVVPKTDRMVEVESATAFRATEHGRMRRLNANRTAISGGHVMGYLEMGFRDIECEYWVMMQ